MVGSTIVFLAGIIIGFIFWFFFFWPIKLFIHRPFRNRLYLTVSKSVFLLHSNMNIYIYIHAHTDRHSHMYIHTDRHIWTQCKYIFINIYSHRICVCLSVYRFIYLLVRLCMMYVCMYVHFVQHALKNYQSLFAFQIFRKLYFLVGSEPDILRPMTDCGLSSGAAAVRDVPREIGPYGGRSGRTFHIACCS